MDVPLQVSLAESDPIKAEVMSAPGAQMLLQEPKLLKEALASPGVVAPTVMASGTKAGEKSQDQLFTLPAATTTATPALVAAFTATSMDQDSPLNCRLTLAMAGLCALVEIQSKACT